MEESAQKKVSEIDITAHVIYLSSVSYGFCLGGVGVLHNGTFSYNDKLF